ncbi:GDSL-like Lipase/Acylhydrolase superfamily protein, putative isoform 2 [Hibiscus syriacus]|uniref:GDSL-like Lipase/Acylhydrolase superfamily protein, putative isoform 2 n=1 Tax=Hibiscus syriacus TaxID=106335 RepID=A0A6A2WKJ8_HIBSY|nr:GDSL-like Lipase/Acylhydrolase superfamily protein, putative isoform 2 [Hibiscus syriacus]
MDPHFKPSKLVMISVLLALSSLQNWANAKPSNSTNAKPSNSTKINHTDSTNANQTNSTNAKPEVPCYFIFGDSLSDNGNNNNLKTLAKVNYPPYGVDFPGGPTGSYMPPFAQAVGKGKEMLNGVNYASGSAGILDETGKYNMGDRIPLNEQILKNHKAVISSITKEMRYDLSATKKLLNKCIYSIEIGSNDFINNYFLPKFYDSSRRYSLSAYTTMLVQQLSRQLMVLYDNGARKFAVFGVPPIGCTPNAISLYGTNGSPCVDILNQAAVLFNERLQQLIREFNRTLIKAKFTYLNPPGAPVDIAEFVKIGACCKTGGGAGELCVRNSKPCSDPKKHIFWDGVHITEYQMEIMAKNAYSSNSTLCASPYNIHNLAML